MYFLPVAITQVENKELTALSTPKCAFPLQTRDYIVGAMSKTELAAKLEKLLPGDYKRWGLHGASFLQQDHKETVLGAFNRRKP